MHAKKTATTIFLLGKSICQYKYQIPQKRLHTCTPLAISRPKRNIFAPVRLGRLILEK